MHKAYLPFRTGTLEIDIRITIFLDNIVIKAIFIWYLAGSKQVRKEYK